MGPVFPSEVQFELTHRQIATPNGPVSIQYYLFPPLEEAGFKHAFSTRQGGVSPLPQNDLNLAYKNDDAPNVEENRRRFLLALNRPTWPIITARQIHSNKVIVVGSQDVNHSFDPEGDALISECPKIFLGVKTADCWPILLASPNSGVFGVVHAGWRGTFNRVVQETLKKLSAQFAVEPRDLMAVLGPGACGKCYEVGDDLVDQFKTQFGSIIDRFVVTTSSSVHLDVRGINIHQLLECGVHSTKIFYSSLCTMHQNNLFFSHRKEFRQPSIHIGRMLSVMGRDEPLF
jgi:hypothetical protein